MKFFKKRNISWREIKAFVEFLKENDSLIPYLQNKDEYEKCLRGDRRILTTYRQPRFPVLRLYLEYNKKTYSRDVIYWLITGAFPWPRNDYSMNAWRKLSDAWIGQITRLRREGKI